MKKYLIIMKNILRYLAVYYLIQLFFMFVISIIFRNRYFVSQSEIILIISTKRYFISTMSGICSSIIYLFMLNNKLNILNKFKIKKGYKYRSLYLVLLAIGWAFSSYSFLLLGEGVSNNTIVTNSLVINRSILINMICSVIMIPLFEEFLFRAIILAEINKYINISRSIVIQAIIFAISHGKSIQIFYNFFFGIILALVYIWTQSLWFSIFTHCIYNLIISIIIPLFIGHYITYYKILGILGLLFLVYALNVICKKNSNTDKVTQKLMLNLDT